MNKVSFFKIASLFFFLLTTQLSFGQEQLLYSENFTSQLNVGAQGPGSSSSVIDPSTAGVTWTIDVSSTNLSSYTHHFKVVDTNSMSERMTAADLDGDALWYSPVIDITNFSDVRFLHKVVGEGTTYLSSNDYVKTHYRINGGTWTQVATDGNLTGNFGTQYPSQTGLSGTTLEIRVTMNNQEYWEVLSMDNVEVYGTSTPAPTASFSASATVVDTSQTITFANNSSDATSYSWNFGDSTTSSATNPNHQYTSAGSYTVTLTATNSSGSDTTTASITVYTAGTCSAVGTILMERYDGIPGTAISDLTGSANYPQSPTYTTQRSSFEIPANVADNYGAKVSGYICAPQTGYYTFWMTSDDNGELNLSTDENPANKTTISYVTQWTPQNVWDDESNQKSNPVLLIAGNSYYVEALMKEAGGGDHLSVGWAKPGQSTNAPSQIIPGSVLSPVVYCPSASFTASGTNVEISQAVTFTNTTTGTSPTYSWDFGDGNTSTATSPTHTYTATGTYTVTLTATNSCGSDTATTSITVNIPSETIAIQDFDGATPDWSYTQTISPTSPVNLFFEDLTGENDGDTTGAASGINWTLSGGGGNNSEVYVHNGDHVHMSENDGTIAIWQTTDNIDITSTANLNFTVKVKKTKNLDSDDYVRLLYSKNGGALIEIATYYNDINDDTIIGGDINSLTGNTLIGNPGDTIKLFMHVRNDSNSEQFEWEEIKLTGNVIDGTINSLGTNTTNAWGNKGYLDEAEITFNTVDLSNHDNLTFSFDYFIDSETETSGDAEDNFVYDIYYNGSETASLTEELIVDGGATDTWASKSVSVPDGTTSIKVIFNYDVTYAFDEHLGLDNVKVTGIIKLPGCATNLVPADTETAVSVTPLLDWDTPASGGTVEQYEVYFGDSESNLTSLGTTVDTQYQYNGANLDQGQTYFWKVVPTNARGDASGCSAVSFTTIIPAPGCATYISPTDGASDVSLTPTLSWNAVSGATGYKLYYGENSNTSTYFGETVNTSVTLPQLGYETQYFWKVVPFNAGGEATGCSVISFTTLKNPAGSVFITGNTVTVSKNAYLYLEKDFTNTEGSLTLNSSSTEFASIIVEGTATGDITYNRFVNYQAYQEWDIIGSPVLNQNMQSFAQTNTTNNQGTTNTTDGALAMGGDYYALGQYLTHWGSWSNYTTSTIPNSSFPAGKGYQMGTNSSNEQGQALTFTGEIATTSQSINIQNQNGTNNGYGRRWNLVANPFSSYINGNTTAGTTNGGTNFIDVNANVMDLEYTGIYYWKADDTGWGEFNQIQTNSDDGTLFIAPGQGFFVAARNSEVAQISFTPQMRTVTGGDDFISGAPMLLNYKLNLKLYNGAAQRAETKFHFQQGLTLGLDPGYDAGAFDQATALSARLPEGDQGTNFQLSAMNIEAAYNQSIPLVINQEVGQNFRVSISENTLPEDINVYLEDTQNGTLTSLKNQDFELVAQEDLSQDGRFYIRFTTQSLAINDVLGTSSITVFKLNTDNFITIKGLSPEMGKTSAILYNMLGMKVREKALDSSQSTQQIATQGLASGVYIINLKAGEQAVSKKVIIQ